MSSVWHLYLAEKIEQNQNIRESFVIDWCIYEYVFCIVYQARSINCVCAPISKPASNPRTTSMDIHCTVLTVSVRAKTTLAAAEVTVEFALYRCDECFVVRFHPAARWRNSDDGVDVAFDDADDSADTVLRPAAATARVAAASTKIMYMEDNLLRAIARYTMDKWIQWVFKKPAKCANKFQRERTGRLFCNL